MALTRTSSRVALLVLLLAVIVLSLFGSLVLADRTLASTTNREVQLDAREAATYAERELLRRVTVLDAAGPDHAGPVGDFTTVWLLDGAGGVRWRSRPGMREDAATFARMAADARLGATPSVRVTNAGDLLLGTVREDGTAAVGHIAGIRVLEALPPGASERSRLTLVAAGHVIASRGADATDASDYSASDSVPIAGDPLTIVVSHPRSSRGPRTLLWLLGVVALAGLAAGLARERAQAVSLAERTAELERLYQEVARSNRMKSEFLANVSHELRTPLNAIVGFVEMLREGVYGELTPRQALPVERIAASANHLRHLVDRLLDIARIAAGRLEVQLEPVVLRPFVLNVASEMESLVAERGLSLTITVSASLPRIRSDHTQLRQILINLIGNAVKYTPTGGVEVRADLVAPGATAEVTGVAPPDGQRPWVAVHVSDTGVGIAHADQERIFDEFEQVNAGARTDSARRGTGLGLAISRRLARLLGGELTVASEPGRGSTFTVWLPVDQEAKGEPLSSDLRDRTSA